MRNRSFVVPIEYDSDRKDAETEQRHQECDPETSYHLRLHRVTVLESAHQPGCVETTDRPLNPLAFSLLLGGDLWLGRGFDAVVDGKIEDGVDWRVVSCAAALIPAGLADEMPRLDLVVAELAFDHHVGDGVAQHIMCCSCVRDVLKAGWRPFANQTLDPDEAGVRGVELDHVLFTSLKPRMNAVVVINTSHTFTRNELSHHTLADGVWMGEVMHHPDR